MAEAGDQTEGMQEDSGRSLLDLPPEIWSRICKYAVIYDEPIIVLAANKRICAPLRYSAFHDAYSDLFRLERVRTIERHRDMLMQPPITRVSSAVRAECLPSFYKDNIFCACDGATVDDDDDVNTYGVVGRWLNCIGGANAVGIKQLYIAAQRFCGQRLPQNLGWWSADAKEDLWMPASQEEAAMLKEGGCCGTPLWRVRFYKEYFSIPLKMDILEGRCEVPS